MGFYINSIPIAAQKDPSSLAAAFANAAANALGWVLDGNSAFTDSSKKLGCSFLVYSDYTVKLNIFNGNTAVATRSLSFSSAHTYYFDYITSQSGKTIAIGFRKPIDDVCLSAVFAENNNGEKVAVSSKYNANGMLCMLRADGLGTYELNYYTNYSNAGTSSATNLCTSIMKMPDVFGTSVFKDLYLVFSCTSQASDLVLLIDGKYYRIIKANSISLAILVG